MKAAAPLNQILVRWPENRPGPVNGGMHVQTQRMNGQEVGLNVHGKSLNLKTDGDDFGFTVSETKVIGKQGLVDMDLGMRTQVFGYAEDGTASADAALKLETAVMKAIKLGKGDGRHDGDITLNVRSLNGSGDQWAHWSAKTAPAPVLDAVKAARSLAQMFDHKHASVLLQTRQGTLETK